MFVSPQIREERGFSVAPSAPVGAFRVIIKTFVSTIIHLEFAQVDILRPAGPRM
jgi:hypothetical protein